MEPDLSSLDRSLADRDLDGYLLDAGADSADQLYLSGLAAPDPFLGLYADGETWVLVPALEYGRAREESHADEVRRLGDYGFQSLVEEEGDTAAWAAVAHEFLAEAGVESVAVPRRFPLATADGLRERGHEVAPDDDDAVAAVRATKTDEEVGWIRTAQRATEAAMGAAEDLLAAAEVVDGVLHHDGEPLTSERVRREIEVTLLREGCGAEETIAAGGADGADPHDRGSGPLPAGEPIVVDVFPRDKDTRYHADMTRTFVVGEPGEEAQTFYETVAAAKRAALEAVEPGVTGAAVHDAACDVIEEAGYPTLRTDESAETGFVHSTGHGVGLEVHEGPRVGPGGPELEPGHVITIEPGLYDPAVGGVRLEDLVVVTEDGHENLTDYPESFRVESGT